MSIFNTAIAAHNQDAQTDFRKEVYNICFDNIAPFLSEILSGVPRAHWQNSANGMHSALCCLTGHIETFATQVGSSKEQLHKQREDYLERGRNGKNS